MIIRTEQGLSEFEFWSSAKHNAGLLTIAEKESVESVLEELYPKGIGETQLNDLFWFDFDWVCESISLDYDEVMERA